LIIIIAVMTGCRLNQIKCHPTRDNGKWFMLPKSSLRNGAHHTAHARIFGKRISGYNYYVLKGIDIVQKTAPKGGGYFTGIKARPTESPIGYELKIFGKSCWIRRGLPAIAAVRLWSVYRSPEFDLWKMWN
jgi:hypothetical protein